MSCKHEGFHEVSSHYDRQAGVIVHIRSCESCGEELTEWEGAEYRPSYDPQGSERFLAEAGAVRLSVTS